MLGHSHHLLVAAAASLHLAALHALRLVPPLHVATPLHHHALAHARSRRRGAYIHLPVLSHIRVHGPAIDYVGLFLLAIVSGLGINGPGEAALIAAAVYVDHHHLAVAPVVLIAAAGGFAGGVAGFLVGRHGGRAIFTVAGPLAPLRRKMLGHSEEVYLRYDALAILLTPAWAAGIHRVGWLKFLWLNAASALLWAALIGLTAYYLGSRLTTEFSNEIGWIVGGVVVALVVYYVIQRSLRAQWRRSR